ncbi:MAG: STAS-like domain-containing protein [Candidatus Kerfeldbacteria bacterium]|nr:STAS-like domain-containing protein [Candidatus Kerfeldbacteria bacterium]
MIIELKKFGDLLISRPAGREAFLALSAYVIRDIDSAEPIEIDFSGVKVLTPSWADEVITKLAERFPNIRFSNTANASVQATLETLREYSGVSYSNGTTLATGKVVAG